MLILAGCAQDVPKIKPMKKQPYIEYYSYNQTPHQDFNTYCEYDEKTIIVSLKNGTGNYAACKNYQIVNRGILSAGRPNTHMTPRGSYKVIWKAYKYDSKKYPSTNGKRNMDRALFFTSEGHALHLGNVRGYSHGCVRVQKYDADFLYEWADYNTKIIIQNRD